METNIRQISGDIKQILSSIPSSSHELAEGWRSIAYKPLQSDHFDSAQIQQMNSSAYKALPDCQILGFVDNQHNSDSLRKQILIPSVEIFGQSKLEDSSNKIAHTVCSELELKPHGNKINKLRVECDMIPHMRDIISFARRRDPSDKSLDGYLTAQTSKPPGNQECYAANVTRPYEEQAMKQLLDLAHKHKHTSQKQLVDIVSSITPDQETSVLTLANLTKNLAGLVRGSKQGDLGGGVTESGVKFLKHRTYTATDAKEVVDSLQAVSSGKDKVGCMYHFYGALAATYFGGRPGAVMVEIESKTHHDSEKAAANHAGTKAAVQLKTHG